MGIKPPNQNQVFSFSGAFSDEDIVHVEGDVDPARDLEIIHDELRLKDLEYLSKRMDTLERSVLRGGTKEKKPEYVGTKRIKHDSFKTTEKDLLNLLH